MPDSRGPEIALWRAVIVQAIEDATNWRASPTSRKKPDADLELIAERERQAQNRIRMRDEARSWLLRDNTDFPRVCHMAMLDPDAVRESAQSLARRGWPVRLRNDAALAA